MTYHDRKRLRYWRLAHCLSIVRLRRRIVFGSALLGVFIALIVTLASTQVFSARATVHDDGWDADFQITNPPQNHLPWTNDGNYMY